MEVNAAELPRRRLGDTRWTVSTIGLGCASYWARPGFPERRALAVMETALDRGVNVFDTGASYAAGHAESRLGRLMDRLGIRPDAVLVSTKIGTVVDDHGRLHRDFSPAGLTRQTDACLRRLGVERIGLVQLHGPVASDLRDEVMTCLEALRKDGKIELLGLNGNQDSIRLALEHPLFDVVMPFCSVRNPDASRLVREAAGRGRGVLIAEPLGRMAFSPPVGSWLTTRSGLWYLARLLRRDARALRGGGRLRSALTHSGWTRAQLALAWVLDQQGSHCAVVGTTRPAHLGELCDAASASLPDPVRQALDRVVVTSEAGR